MLQNLLSPPTAMRRGSIRILSTMALGLVVVQNAAAFTGDPISNLPPPAALNDRTVQIFGFGLVASGMVSSIDEPLRQRMRSPWVQRSAWLSSSASAFEQLGGPAPLLSAVALSAVGRGIGNESLADVSFHVVQALAFGGAASATMKVLVGRRRPFSGAHRVNDLQFGAGFSGGNDFRSFPSGHTISAFALASTLSAEIKVRWPAASRCLSPLLYASATGTGLSRIYHDQHWGSDVVMGALLGTIIGKAVVRHHHPTGSPAERRWDMRLTPHPKGHAQLGWVLRF